MRIAIVGGGPAGLYFAILAKRLDDAHEVTVYERNAADDTFGFGVVFSDETLAAFEAADPESYEEITRAFVRWSEIDVHYHGEVITSGGHGFSAARLRTPSGSPSPHTSGGTTPWWRESMRSQTAWPTRWLPIVQTFRPWRSSSSRRPRQYASSASAASTSK